MTEPQTRRFAVISGAHIAPETARLLTDTPVRQWPVEGGVFAYGVLIYAHDENCEGTIPPDVWSVCEWATARGFDYVMLDCDAEPVDGLPVYDYGDSETASAPHPASPGADYLDRFPPEHRESADRAYQDGFADGANNAGEDGEESEGEAAPPFRAVFSLEIDLDRLEAIGAQAVDALEAASLELENNGAFLAGPVEIDGQAVGIMGYAPADQLRKPKPQSASPDPEGQSAPEADDGAAETWTEWDDEALDNLTDDATHAVNNLIPAIKLDYMTHDERSGLLVRINDALSPILADVLQS